MEETTQKRKITLVDLIKNVKNVMIFIVFFKNKLKKKQNQSSFPTDNRITRENLIIILCAILVNCILEI